MIVFSGEEKNRGIGRAVFHVVVGRVGVERFELLGIFHRAEFGDVEGAVGIEFDAQHVVDADEGDDRAEQVGTLGEGRAHQQAAIAATDDGKVGRRGVLVVDEVLGTGDEVVEDILLVGEVAGLVPFFAVFAAAAKVGGCT